MVATGPQRPAPRCLGLALALHLCASGALAQQLPLGAGVLGEPGASVDAPVAVASGSPSPQRQRDAALEEADADAVRTRTLAIIAANSLAVAVYGKRNWWDQGFDARFRTANEGWFGQHTYSGGADKLGHFFANYASARLFTRAFAWAGNGPAESLQLAAWLTLGTFTAVEVLDGFSKQWRFSKQDGIMNAAGVGAALLMERNPGLDRILDLRFLYRPSGEEGKGYDPFGDYSGQTYLAVLKASGFPALRSHPVLRYVELSVGYGTRGYSSSDPRRNIAVGVSLNLSELLNATVFRHATHEGRAQHLADTALEFVQVPGTGVFARHRLRGD